jgi:hypothetical protein
MLRTIRSYGLNLYVQRRNILATGVLALMLGSALGVALFSLGGVYFDPIFTYLGPLQRFSSYEDLKIFLTTSSQSVPWGGYYRVEWQGACAPGLFDDQHPSRRRG